MKRLEEVEKDIKDLLKNSYAKTDLEHGVSAKRWVLKLKPDADKALEIAALAHDIERTTKNPLKEDYSDYEKMKRGHSRIGAKIVCDILKRHNFDTKFIQRVRHLVENHEFGGDNDTDLLKDADSIAFFEVNIGTYLKRFGLEKTKKKIKFMFERSSEKAKNIIRKFRYGDEKLNKIFQKIVS